MPDLQKLTALEIHEASRNGFSEDALRRYQAERDAAAGFVEMKRGEIFVQPFVAGNVVTQFARPRAPITHTSAMQHNPHKWGRS